MKVYAGSVSGVLHDKKNIGNQDSYATSSKNGYTLLVVSDGLGSHGLSHVGSKLVVDGVVKHFNELFTPEADSLVFQAREIIDNVREELAKTPDCDRMGCTLNFAIVGEDDLILAGVGDSFTVIGEDGCYERFTANRHFEFVNMTDTLIDGNPHIRHYSDSSNIDTIAVGSDGLDGVSLENGEVYYSFWDSLARRARNDSLDMSEFLNFLKNSGRLDDDATLLLGVR